MVKSNEKNEIRNIAIDYADCIWNKKDLSFLTKFLDEKIVIHSLLGDFHGPESMKKVVQTWLTGFPNLSVKNSSVICENDLVVLHWHAQGTHQGEFKGIQPTGRPVVYAGTTIYRIRENKIVEYWAYLDMQHLLKQIS